MPTKQLEEYFKELDMTPDHARVYIASLELGESPASFIAKKTLIPRSTVYTLLEDLAEVGLISSYKLEARMVFSPSSPTQLELLLKEKRQNISNALDTLIAGLPLLLQMYKSTEILTPRLRFHKGEYGLKTVYYDCLSADEVCIFCQGSSEFQNCLKDDPIYLKDFIRESQIRKLRTREILSDTPAAREYKEKYSSDYTQILVIPQNTTNMFGHVDKHIYRNKVAYISHDNLVGVIIEDIAIALHEKSQFELLWSSLSPKIE